MKKTNEESLLNSTTLDVEIAIPFVDRIRILFGCPMYMSTLVKSRWAGTHTMQCTYLIDKLYKRVLRRLHFWKTAANVNTTPESE
jgi:hypothetical protein